MFVAYVWPFRELPESLERKTFFWLECTYDEAIEVLGQVRLSPEDFRNYTNHLYEFRANGLGERDLDEWLSVYKRVGFLISEVGAIAEWAPPGYPISNQWDAYNPFLRVEPIELNRYEDFRTLARAFSKNHPHYSTLVSTSRIPARLSLSSLKGEDPERIANHFIGGSDLARLACKVFYSKYVPGGQGKDDEPYFFEDSIAQREAAEEFKNAKQSNIVQETDSCKHTIDYKNLTISEIYQRKTRAIANLRRAEKLLENSARDEHFPDLPFLKALSDDEICELALLMERHHRSLAIKWILGEFIERVSRRGEETSMQSQIGNMLSIDTLGPDDFIVRGPCPLPAKLRDRGLDSIIQDLTHPDDEK